MYTIATLPQGKASSHLNTSSRGCFGNPSSNHPAQAMLVCYFGKAQTSSIPGPSKHGQKCQICQSNCHLSNHGLHGLHDLLSTLSTLLFLSHASITLNDDSHSDLDFELPNSFIPTSKHLLLIYEFKQKHGVSFFCIDAQPEREFLPLKTADDGKGSNPFKTPLLNQGASRWSC